MIYSKIFLLLPSPTFVSSTYFLKYVNIFLVSWLFYEFYFYTNNPHLRRNIKIYLLWLTKKRNPLLGKGNEISSRRRIVWIQTKKRKNPSWDGTSGHPQKKGLNAFILNLDSVKRECFTLSSLNDENSCKNSFLSR